MNSISVFTVRTRTLTLASNPKKVSIDANRTSFAIWHIQYIHTYMNFVASGDITRMRIKSVKAENRGESEN